MLLGLVVLQYLEWRDPRHAVDVADGRRDKRLFPWMAIFGECPPALVEMTGTPAGHPPFEARPDRNFSYFGG